MPEPRADGVPDIDAVDRGVGAEGLDDGDCFVTNNKGKRDAENARDGGEIGVAEGGGLDADEELAAGGLGDGEVLDFKGLIGLPDVRLKVSL